MAYIGLLGLLCVAIGFVTMFKPPSMRDLANGGASNARMITGAALFFGGWAAMLFAMPVK